jgi:plastocyanin
MRRNFLILFTIVGFLAGCGRWDKSLAPQDPAPANVQTVTVGATPDDRYTPDHLTIPVGSTVVWDSSLQGHTVHFDNGDNATCGNLDLTTFPNQTVFNRKGTFTLHCDTDSPCGPGSCSHCTGMVLVVNVV